MTQNNSISGHWLIVSDLDGTLLDHYDYSHGPVDDLLRRLELRQTPVILNSSKTLPEMLELRRQLHNRHPFIVENGSAVFIPADYFPEMPDCARERDEFWVIETGVPRGQLLEFLQADAAEHDAPYLSFARASCEEIVDATGLTPEQALAAQRRDYSEPLLWRGSEEEKQAFVSRVSAAGLSTLQGGRFLHLLGTTDKGGATLKLMECYRNYRDTDYRLIAAGDSPNDLDMLRVADIAVIIRAPHRQPPQLQARAGQRVIVSDAVGPEGWRETIGQLFP
ncbi:mannosyl-3-phosphoglycerate phosphatase [Microbulbifer marinus]|uniref:Mannosyl-3-phosphoglycerate phosphatase n=2 Tax=Microbulbifer marinus TaxID=658218 RepID=A0A1H3WSA4_9GAMM|nr:mannosyl-3-phosphoglycerate phosphatase [Microbulbifer marinus]